ncbi:MAG: hypothetical protein IPM51_01810 [Sphingobacteriaceae bacterium]|nr:hypothetical protein [Sphingobacteriaceae bacterium]
MLKGPVQVAPFAEHIILDIARCEPHEFDVISLLPDQPSDFILTGKFSLQQYCQCLLRKLFSLNKSKIKPFIQYQCEQLADPFVWLNKFEKLIDLNRELFITKEQNIKIEKALMVIELIRQDIENNKFNKAARFDFDKVKSKLKQYATVEDQLCFLYEAKADYQQNKPKLVDPTDTPFDEKIVIEIEKIEQLEQLKKRAPERAALLNGKNTKKKIPIRGHLNILVDAFYQMLHEKKANGLPYLDANATEITTFIVDNFVDKDGQPISESTVRTILSPNKPEKRPKNDNKINL